MELEKVVIGDKVTEKIYVFKSIKKASGEYDVIIKDKTGELNCKLAAERFDESLLKSLGGAVKVTFVVKYGLNTQPLGVIKSIAPAPAEEYNAADLFDGLQDEKIASYIMSIQQSMNNIADAQIKNLVSKILTDDVLDALASLPASLSHHGKYRGGALAATAVVTKMCIQAGFQYIKGDNGIYKPSLDWNTLIAASLLHCVGVIDYYTPVIPFAKTSIGVERGYQSTAQHFIERIIIKDGIEIDEMQLARIFNIIGSSVPMKSGIKATSSEGIILRQCLMLYEELDIIDASIASHEIAEGEEYFYAAHRNISLMERKAS